MNNEKMRKILLYGLVLMLVAVMASAAPLGLNDTGANSQTYWQNYNTMVAKTLDPEFNTTFLFSNGTHTLLDVPEYSSSTQNDLTTLVSSYNTSPVNFTHHEIRSDLFSEVGIVLAMSNQSVYIDAWYNTLVGMGACEYEILPCWVVLRDGNSIVPVSSGNDTAIDGTVRSITALYIAANNTAFSEANRSKYLTYANLLSEKSYQYEFIQIADTTTSSGRITMLPMGGGDCAGFGISCGTDIWVGYLPDIADAFLYAYNNTGNQTYLDVARNVTAAFVQVALQNDTDGDGFGTAPFNFNWDGVGATLGHTDGGGVNTYHYNPSNPQHDDSDAPRWHSAGKLLYTAETMNVKTGAFVELDNFITQWFNATPFTSTTSCLQYRYNGSCSTSIRSGYYENGYGALLHLGQNESTLGAKINETLSHYSFSSGTYDGSVGGTTLTYRGLRPLKALGFGIGLSDMSVTSSATSNTTLTDFSILWENASDTVSGGSATWYADVRTNGSILITNSSGIFLTSIVWVNSTDSCSASSLSLTSGNYNTSTFESTFGALVTCTSLVEVAVQATIDESCSNTYLGLETMGQKLSLIVSSFVAVLLLGILFSIMQYEKKGFDVEFMVSGLMTIMLLGIILVVGIWIISGIC